MNDKRKRQIEYLILERPNQAQNLPTAIRSILKFLDQPLNYFGIPRADIVTFPHIYRQIEEKRRIVFR